LRSASARASSAGVAAGERVALGDEEDRRAALALRRLLGQLVFDRDGAVVAFERLDGDAVGEGAGAIGLLDLGDEFGERLGQLAVAASPVDLKDE
jgi:hypothetical protein